MEFCLTISFYTCWNTASPSVLFSVSQVCFHTFDYFPLVTGSIFQILASFICCLHSAMYTIHCIFNFLQCILNLWLRMSTFIYFLFDIFIEFLFSRFIYLWESLIYREEERQRGRSSVRWFTPQVSATGRYYANPKPGASSGSPTRVQGPKGSWKRSGAAGIEPAPIWDPRRARRGP